MSQTKMTEEQKEEFQMFFGFKSKLGIFWILQCVVALLAVIGFLCPLFSYNETKIDALKETVSLTDVPIAIGGLAFLFIAIVLTMLIVMVFQRAISQGTQAKLNTKLIGFTVGIGVSLFLSVIMVCVAYILYDVPSSDYVELDFAAGFYLFVIGSAVYFLLNLLFTAVARNVLNGKTKREQVLFGTKKGNTNNQTKERTTEEKLNELKRLRDTGVLTEEEFETKKKELLDNMK